MQKMCQFLRVVLMGLAEIGEGFLGRKSPMHRDGALNIIISF